MLADRTYEERWSDYRQQSDRWAGRGDRPQVSGPAPTVVDGHQVTVTATGLVASYDSPGVNDGKWSAGEALWEGRCAVCRFLSFGPKAKVELHGKRHEAVWAAEAGAR